MPQLDRIITGAARDDVLAAINFLQLKGTFVEIGTFTGEFADHICRFTQFGKLFCVDPYTQYEKYEDGINSMDMDHLFLEAKNKVARYGEKVEFLRQFSVDAAKKFSDNSLDFVYIDGNHQYDFVYQDLEAWYPKVRQGGLLCGDDAVDIDETERDASGNIRFVWSKDAVGVPTSWGTYGVIAALKKFGEENKLKYILSGNQFLIHKI
ncbi:MAG TPA: class I SAM-dependent methyltransferase [Stellaceae bacterium]|nr:class I SAM-dependent methyltransferase [Stellaceae bacterium]